MSEPDALTAAAARRARLGAAAIVGLVVLVLGFGAGIGAVFERDADGGGDAAPTTGVGVAPGVGGGGRVEASVTPAASTSTGSGGAGGSSGGRAGAPTTTPTTAAPTTSTSTTSSTSTTAPGAPSSPPPTAPPAGGCGLLSAMVNPFLAHFEAAHLETSPGQQVADAMNTDDYVLAHTDLIAAIVAPLLNLVLDLDGTSPLWSHLTAAHLESSPGQQVADLLDIDDYLLAHTVLVDDMLLGEADRC